MALVTLFSTMEMLSAVLTVVTSMWPQKSASLVPNSGTKEAKKSENDSNVP